MAAASLADPQALAERLLATTSRIGDLLRSEAAAVEDPLVETLTTLQTRKRDLARDLREATSLLSAHAEVPEHWSAERREDVRRSLLAMQEAVNVNARTLGVKVQTGRHLMSAVTRAVRSMTAEGNRYDPAARTASQPAGGRAKSVLVNHVA